MDFYVAFLNLQLFMFKNLECRGANSMSCICPTSIHNFWWKTFGAWRKVWRWGGGGGWKGLPRVGQS